MVRECRPLAPILQWDGTRRAKARAEDQVSSKGSRSGFNYSVLDNHSVEIRRAHLEQVISVSALVVRTLFSIRSNTGSDMDQAESTEEDGVFTTISLADDSVDSGSTVSDSKLDSELFMMNTEMEVIDPENQVELEEKTRLIKQVLELQHTLEELSARVDAVKEENLKLKSENQVLGQYIENLMSASSVFQTTDTKSKRK
ncbi:short coiled-coil protein A isoform X1 [Heterodontus francisci]|uniref:short coiled-coil protein A isoform X1 n=2 Tax=Heterodontus francisci TaxID=7792 RepID=UPI00355B7B2E